MARSICNARSSDSKTLNPNVEPNRRRSLAAGEKTPMVRRLIELSLDNPLFVLLLALVLVAGGAYALWNVNVEAYPDPAPAIIEVVAQRPGWSAEEMERQVTIPI